MQIGYEESIVKHKRCGRHSYSVRKKKCSACGYGASSKIKRYSWQNKKLNRKRIV